MAQNLNSILEIISQAHQEIFGLTKLKTEQEKRLQDLQKAIDERQTKLNQLQEMLSPLKESCQSQEKELSQAENNLSKAISALDLAANQESANAAQKQIDTLTPLVERLGDDILVKLEKIEELEKEALELEQFLNSSQETQTEIQQEVEEELSKLSNQEEVLETSFKTEVLSGVRSNFQSDIQSVRKRFFSKNPFSKVNQRSCSQCGQTLDSFQLTDLQKGEELQLCGGCGRILFIPS